MERIKLLSSLLKESKIVLDCGCDHGYVLIDALKKYNIKEAIFSDINEEPLSLARKNFKESNIDKKASFILSDGLKNIEILM